MLLPTPITRDIVLVGGGHSHALVLRMWGMNPLPGVRLTLISPEPVAAYSGMLPGLVAGHYPREALEVDLVRLARFADARLVLAPACGIDRAAGRVEVSGRAPIAYDLLSLDFGISSDMPGLTGFAGHAVPAKPLAGFADRWLAFAEAVAAGRAAPDVAVIGAGLAGTELALSVRHRLGPGARVTLIEAGEPLRAVGGAARRSLSAALRVAGVELVTGAPVVEILAGAVRLESGRQVPSAFTIGAAGAAAQGWLRGTGLALHDGFVRARPTLQSETDPAIFAAGDIAHLAFDSRPKAGVFAVRAAPVLLHNLRAAATGRGSLRPFRPQRDYLKLVSAGGRVAVADKWGLSLSGPWIWRWKDRIDRAFMAKFHDLPAMPAPDRPDPPGEPPGRPLCAGCGAKVGRGALQTALSGLSAPARADVETGAGDDAAVLRVGGARQVITTDHLRAFTSDPWLMARIAAVHALGDVWSMGAAPQAALAQVILPPMGERQQAEALREIMDAAAGVFGPEGAEIVGGHTSLGAEFTLGFTVTGLCAGPAITHGGARAGDRLILTKPLGTGVILAAEMAGRATGRWVAAAYDSMARPSGAAARLLAPHARAMTDVTGFGLAGHLLTILEASQVAARLDLAAVPVLEGAAGLAQAGEGSSLLPANRQAAARMTFTDGPNAELLFDPQTAGGLLAAVPADVAQAVLADLRAAGEPAAIIGEVIAGEPGILVEA
jgi:selenide,water dikinase